MEDMTIGISNKLIIIVIALFALCLLVLTIVLLRHIAEGGRNSGVKLPLKPDTAGAGTEDTIVRNVTEGDDAELIAAIMAAIASSLNIQTDKLIVRSFRKVPGWTETARKESIG